MRLLIWVLALCRTCSFLHDTEFPQPLEDRRRMTSEIFCNFFEAGIGGTWTYLQLPQFGNFHFGSGYLETRCSKSCYLCVLELADLFEVVEQVVFSGMIFLLTGQWTFIFTSLVASYCFFQSLIEHTCTF